jgi:hypothetical protein
MTAILGKEAELYEKLVNDKVKCTDCMCTILRNW